MRVGTAFVVWGILTAGTLFALEYAYEFGVFRYWIARLHVVAPLILFSLLCGWLMWLVYDELVLRRRNGQIVHYRDVVPPLLYFGAVVAGGLPMVIGYADAYAHSMPILDTLDRFDHFMYSDGKGRGLSFIAYSAVAYIAAIAGTLIAFFKIGLKVAQMIIK